MIELFEQNIKTNDRQSSKGNQLKWENNGIWYKSDYMGYEGLTEYIISHLLKYSNLKEDEYILYNLIEIKYKNQKYNGVSSENFLKEGDRIITLERLFQSYFGKSLHNAIWNLEEPKDRIGFIVKNVEKITGLKDFGRYMNIMCTIDMFFLNEDRHTHNIAVILDKNNKFNYCPIFDNGAGLLSDTIMDYPLGEDIYKLIDSVKAKTFSSNFEEQTEESEKLYECNLHFNFTKKDIEKLLSTDEISIYSKDILERVKTILYEQMRRYPYLF